MLIIEQLENTEFFVLLSFLLLGSPLYLYRTSCFYLCGTLCCDQKQGTDRQQGQSLDIRTGAEPKVDSNE